MLDTDEVLEALEQRYYAEHAKVSEVNARTQGEGHQDYGPIDSLLTSISTIETTGERGRNVVKRVFKFEYGKAEDDVLMHAEGTGQQFMIKIVNDACAEFPGRNPEEPEEEK
jgi:hypothetical protein